MPTKSDEAKLPELKQQAIEWLILLRTHDITEAQTHAFADWLSEDILHADAFAKAEDVFNAMVVAARSPRVNAPVVRKTSEPDNTEPAFTNTKHTPFLSGVRRKPFARYPSWLALPLALAAIWLIAVNLVLPKQSHLLDDYLSDYHTNTGEQREVQLADGSQILLNTNTAVSVDYQESSRHITLHHGQARFTVAKDAQRPFKVNSGVLTVRALGTIFDVYQQESGEIDVTVQEHAVSASIQNEDRTSTYGQPTQIKVQEGQRLRYNGYGNLNQPEPVDGVQTAAWQQRRLFINDRPLAELVEELDRYRVGRIFLSDAKLKNLRVTGMFSLADPDAALDKVRKILALQETQLGPWWVLLHR
jgi:transmembrane sensor